ncbi:MAG: DinB family protein [Niabella sp.]
MNQHFGLIRITRNNFIELLNGLHIEQLNKVPVGFNNNIAWNFGHIVVAAQVLCYRFSGLPLNIDSSFVERYKKGSKPEAFIAQEEIDLLKHLSLSNIDQLETDYNNGVFKGRSFTPYITSFNVELNNIEEAIAMVQSHEALHYGYAQAQRRLVH